MRIACRTACRLNEALSLNLGSEDLQSTFPGMRGLSRSNLHYMRAFGEAYPDEAIVQQPVGQLAWGHNVYLVDTVKDPAEREWYARKTIDLGWSRSVLIHQVKGDLYHRQGKAPSNFATTLPAPDSGVVQDMLKDPYNFDFLALSHRMVERDVHRGLVAHMRDFLTELGRGFAFVGSEYQLELNGREYRLDLLFYHLQLRRFVVIELKPGEFEPEKRSENSQTYAEYASKCSRISFNEGFRCLQKAQWSITCVKN